MRQPESYEREDIERYLESVNAWFFHPVTMGFGNSGAPDLLCCIDGQFIGIEVKREGKLPTPLQERRMSEIRAAGGAAFYGTAAKVIPELKQWLSHRRKVDPGPAACQ